MRYSIAAEFLPDRKYALAQVLILDPLGHNSCLPNPFKGFFSREVSLVFQNVTSDELTVLKLLRLDHLFSLSFLYICSLLLMASLLDFN